MTLQPYNQDQTLVSQYSAAAVIGLGATGYSVVRYLRARGLDVVVLDSRDEPPLAQELSSNYPEVQCHFGEFDYANIAQMSLVVASPGVALTQPVSHTGRPNVQTCWPAYFSGRQYRLARIRCINGPKEF